VRNKHLRSPDGRMRCYHCDQICEDSLHGTSVIVNETKPPRTPYRYQEIGYICSECEIAGKPSRFYSYKGEHPKKVTAAVLAALLCLSTHAAEFGLTWSRKAEPVRTNYNGQVVSGRIAEPTKEFWQAWRTNKAELKEQGYTCRPIGKHWQVIRIEEKGSK
jgi:hypothetical protein